MPPPDPDPAPPSSHLTAFLRAHPLLPAIWALQISSLLGLSIALFFFARIQSDDGDSGDHILAAILQLTTLFATLLVLLLTLAEPLTHALPPGARLELRGYLLLQAVKLGIALVVLGLVLHAVWVRWHEGWRPGPRELGVGVGCGGLVVLSFAAGVTYAGMLLRKGRAVGDGGGETAPLLGSPEL